MAKKHKTLFVWQKPQPKIRKTRQTKHKYREMPFEALMQEIESASDNSQGQQPSHYQIIKASQPIDIQQGDNIVAEKERKDYKQLQLREELKRQQMRNQLNQRLKVIKEILYNEKDNGSQSNLCNINIFRQFQCNQIRAFLAKKQSENAENSNVIYIYGTPGTGKTFTIKALLSNLHLQPRIKWINCLVMLNKSLLRYTEQLVEANERKDIIVIDEFDQMEKQFKNMKYLVSFKTYLKEILTKTCIASLSQMKFIFISNKSYQSISEQFVQGIKDMVKAECITQIPFLPYICNYNPSDIFAILKKKTSLIQTAVGGEPIFSNSFLQMTSKREYSKFQDVRKVISFIYSHYESEETSKLSSENMEKKNELAAKEEQGPQAHFILSMPYKQKLILKKLLLSCQAAAEKKSQALVEQLYQQGSKKGICRNTMDLWLREWGECGLVSLRNCHREGHQLYHTNAIVSHLDFNDCQHYFF